MPEQMSMRISPNTKIQKSPNSIALHESRLSPDRMDPLRPSNFTDDVVCTQYRRDRSTSEDPKVQIQEQSPEGVAKEPAQVAMGVNVGGYEILPQTVGSKSASGGQPFVPRSHNLRYSSAVNDFNQKSSLPQDYKLPLVSSATAAATASGTDALSQEDFISIDTRQRQAMQLINEDNPFEKPVRKANPVLPRSSITMFNKAVAKATDRSE